MTRATRKHKGASSKHTLTSALQKVCLVCVCIQKHYQSGSISLLVNYKKMSNCKKETVVSKQHCRCCVSPCPRYMAAGDIRDLCVICLGAEYARSALYGGDCLGYFSHCVCSAPAWPCLMRAARLAILLATVLLFPRHSIDCCHGDCKWT